MRKLGFLAIVMIAFAAILSCSMPVAQKAAPAIGWDEFFSGAVRSVNVDGATKYLVEGDVLASSIDEVKSYYETLIADGSTGVQGRSSVNVVRKNGKYVADVYTATQKLNLTYTIDPAISATVKSDLVWALGQWSSLTGCVFKNVTGTSTTPLFKLRNATASEESSMPGVIASAFFPSYSKKELILFQDFYDLFSNGGTFYGWDSKAVLTHELGHGIGLRHEFIWTKYASGWKQTGETSSQAWLLSANRDDYSIMYYPQYSAYKGNGRISTLDIAGVKSLYQ